MTENDGKYKLFEWFCENIETIKNWCKGNRYDKQTEKQENALWGPPNDNTHQDIMSRCWEQ